mmetsp:Transcript_36924/g.96700  ORF Transcript_36924/g.96700 Transcript_36924/m.96700 type:complete len:416 (+) Transcript_36924:92-1339(+)
MATPRHAGVDAGSPSEWYPAADVDRGHGGADGHPQAKTLGRVARPAPPPLLPSGGGGGAGRWQKQPAADAYASGDGSPQSASPIPSNILAHELGAPSWGRRGDTAAMECEGGTAEDAACNESHTAPAVPTDIGDYVRSDDVLGRGSFSTVFEGIRQSTGDAVAIKAVQMGRRGIEAFQHEVRMNKVLEAHPNVVRLMDSVAPGRDGPLGFLVFELCTGGELFLQLVPNAGLAPRSRIGTYFSQLVAAVAHVHRCGLCHLDIKPENLLLCKQSGRLKLGDFGLSTLAEDGAVQGVRGSRSYAAPENLRSKATGGAHAECLGDLAYNGQQADMWSVGVVLFLFLYGYTPWDVADNSSYEFRMYKMVEGFPAIKPWTRMPTVFRKLFMHTLSVWPSKRWTAEELQTCITHDLGWRVPS